MVPQEVKTSENIVLKLQRDKFPLVRQKKVHLLIHLNLVPQVWHFWFCLVFEFGEISDLNSRINLQIMKSLIKVEPVQLLIGVN